MTCWESLENSRQAPSTRYRDLARRRSNEGRPLHRERGAWVIARRGSSPHESLSTLYWAQPRDLGKCASGFYEGAKTRIRLRSFESSALACEVGKIFQQSSKSWSVQS